MSQAQTPPNRMVGSTGWRRHARILIIILGGSGIAIVAVVLLNSGPGPRKETLVSATSIPSTYTPTPPPDIIRAAARPGPPSRDPPPSMQMAAETPKAPPPPSIQITYFHRPDGQRPEYMKPKPVAAKSADPASGIDYKPDTFDGTTAFVLQHPELVLPQ